MEQTLIAPAVSSDAGLGVSASINDVRLKPFQIGVPSLCNGCPPLCEGCGEPKTYLGKEASSLVACHWCFRKLPKWLKEAWSTAATPELAMQWENRIAVVLIWMREATTPENNQAVPAAEL